MDHQRKLLEDLMNPLIGIEKSFKDSDVCKNHLVAFCPFELFTNTKVDMGSCKYKNHSDKLQRNYQESSERGRFGWEEEFYDFAKKLVVEVDKKIKRTKDRISSGAEVYSLGGTALEIDDASKEEKVAVIEVQITGLIQSIEEFGESGHVDQALEYFDKITMLKANAEAIRMSSTSRRIVICDTCNAYLVANDSTQRLMDHKTGKQHVGYGKLREWVKLYEEQGAFRLPAKKFK